MTHEDSAGQSGPAPTSPPSGAGAPGTASPEPDATATIPSASQPDAATAPLPASSAQAAPSAEAFAAGPESSTPHATPTRRARLGARWHTSMPLRVVTAVVVALLIGGIGFTAGTAFTGDDGHRRSDHAISATHPFWQDHEGWIHRGDHIRHRLRLAPPTPSAAPAPNPAPLPGQ